MKNIAVVFGGRSGEYEVSKKSASAIVKNLDHSKYNVIPVAITKDGRWFGPIKENDVESFEYKNYAQDELYALAIPGGFLKYKNSDASIKLDAIMPIVHGTYGEDGILQGLFELMDVPYVGANVLGSAVGMDKIIMRKILTFHNIPQVNFVALERKDVENNLDKVISDIEKQLAYPIFVKPSNAGSSVGVSKAHNKEQLIGALNEASKFDNRILAEEGVLAREVEMSVMGNEEPVCSVAGEIVACNEFYDYKAKYIDNKSEVKIPADITVEQKQKIEAYAKEAYLALDCKGLGRMDFFIDKNTNNIYLNEINTLPGFTEISMYAKLWAEVGMDMTMLLDELLNYAYERFNDRKRNVIEF